MVRMSRSARMLLLGAVLGSLVLPTVAAAGNPGSSGLLFLRIGVGGREAGMGDAGVAVATGASAIYWNPANNVFADFKTELAVQHYSYLGEFDHEAAAVAQRVGKGVLGFLFTGLYSPEIPRYGEVNVGVPEGTYSSSDVAFGASFAYPLGERLGVAVNAKVVYEKIDLYSDTGLAFDFFLSHRAMIEGMIIAASMTNLGGQMNLNEQPFDLPQAVRVGVAYTPVGGVFQGKATFAGDVFMPNDTNEKAHLGLEYRLIPEFTLRLGTKINYDLQGMTAGAGFNLGTLGLDYAYQDSKIEGFQEGHRFSLKLLW